MYINQTLYVKWNSSLSDEFSVSNGVKQGGVTSPVLFCMYIDDLLLRLKNSGYGCHIGPNYCGSFGYADDIILVAPSVGAMNNMLGIIM